MHGREHIFYSQRRSFVVRSHQLPTTRLHPEPLSRRNQILVYLGNIGKVCLIFRIQSHLQKLTSDRFDRFLLLNNLSREPTFRWCLNPACESGELFDSDSLRPRIRCNDCEFEMCFRCGIPWHTGVTCSEFQGDPQIAATRALIQSNTKACPGPNCSIRIEKGVACFHMSKNTASSTQLPYFTDKPFLCQPADVVISFAGNVWRIGVK